MSVWESRIAVNTVCPETSLMLAIHAVRYLCNIDHITLFFLWM